MAAPSTTTTQADERYNAAQLRHVQNMVSDAVAKIFERLNPTKVAAQQLADRGDELVATINDKVAELLEVETFEDEEEGFDAQYDYPQNFAAKSITEQVTLLRQIFPQLGGPNEALLQNLVDGAVPMPEGSEGWYAIPNPAKLAPTYGEALQTVIDRIATTRKLHNYRAGALGPDRLRRTQRTTEMLAKLSELQGNPDILIVAAQFGKRHAGRSVRRARFVLTTNEFGLGGYEVACMLLTHPERLVHYDNLWIDCPGDEYDYDAGGSWGHAPLWDFSDGQLRFGTGWFDDVLSDCGSASGFLPQ